MAVRGCRRLATLRLPTVRSALGLRCCWRRRCARIQCSRSSQIPPPGAARGSQPRSSIITARRSVYAESYLQTSQESWASPGHGLLLARHARLLRMDSQQAPSQGLAPIGLINRYSARSFAKGSLRLGEVGTLLMEMGEMKCCVV